MKAVILNNEGNILIIQESENDKTRSHGGKWDVPGGRLEFGEDPYQGLFREVHEEVGLKVTVQKPLNISHWTPMKNNEEWFIVALFVMCKPLTEQITLSAEHQSFAWISKEEMDKFNIIPTTKKILSELERT